MTALILTAYYLAVAVRWTWNLAGFCAIGLGAWALIDTLRRPAQNFIAADKRTKGFWLAVNAVGVLVVAFSGLTSFFGLLGVVANAVYLADVRPALNYYRPVRVRVRIRRRGQDGRGGAGGRRR
ncbi:DUF2516 family protein [Actinomyces israelii]|uniref:DUF2516 family protein n=1 Tax=Actinomyces israelii TaxID=1659 RepID=UPI0005BA3906|nr:DUF2516 family protein [Actinomyces israelii]